MDKLDVFFFIPLAYILRTTLIFITLAWRKSSSVVQYIYDYWFHPFDNYMLRYDIITWTLFFGMRFLLVWIYALHLIKIIIWFFQVVLLNLQRIPGTSILLFWPKFYRDILLGPGRSIMDMLWDPRYKRDPSQQSRVSRSTRRQLLLKGRVKIQPTHAKYYLHQDYQVEGA